MNVKYRIYWEKSNGATGHLPTDYYSRYEADKECETLNQDYAGKAHYWPVAIVDGEYHDSESWGTYPAAVRKW